MMATLHELRGISGRLPGNSSYRLETNFLSHKRKKKKKMEIDLFAFVFLIL